MDKTLWFNDDLQYTFNQNIVEYDMKAASLQVCAHEHLLDEETINLMRLMPKDTRTVKMGLIIRDKKANGEDFSSKLINGILSARKRFLQANNLTDEDVLSLHSDAVIFASKKEIQSIVDGYEFVCKSNWTSYIRYDRMEMFYKNGFIEYKGIPEEMRQQHTLGLNKHLVKIFKMMEDNDPSILQYLASFQHRYLQDRLPEYYYHSLGKLGPYKLANLELLSFLTKIVLREMRRW